MAAYTTIDDPEAYFQVQLYTGNGSANHAITLGGDTDMQPDLVWIKNRDASDDHCIFDSVRGATKLLTGEDGAETTDTDTLDSFTSDGFQVDADVKVNTSSEKYVAWCWKESATSGLDIIGYTGDASAGTTAHNLSAVPKMIFVKEYSHATNWAIYHVGTGNTNFLKLNTTAAVEDTDNWNDTDPTSSVFSLGGGGQTNNSGRTYIAYVFADVQGFSKFGSYTGNGNADGPFVYTGFRPAWAMFKKTNGAADWEIMDNKRAGYNDATYKLVANETNIENTDTGRLEILSNGFKIRTTGTGLNTSGGTYIYAAFAEAPFVNSNGVPCNAR